MGRFGNVMLINGDLELSAEAAVGEVVRLYVVNTANTRIFNFGLKGARMKHVGGDSGRCECECFVDTVLLAPSERAVLDVLFETPGDVRLEHHTPDHVYDLGTISVTGSIDGEAAASFDHLRTDPELSAAREQLEHDLQRPPDKVLAFWSEMPLLYGDDGTKTESETAYHECPMHPEVAASFAGTCPKCGMKLVPASPEVPTPMPYACPMHDEIVAAWAASCPLCGMTLLRSDGEAEAEDGESVPHSHGPGDSIEWEDDMVAINRQTNTTQHDLATHRPRDRREERRHLLEVHGRRPRQDPPRQRDGLGPPDATPVPRPRRGTLPRPLQGRRDRDRTLPGRTPCCCSPAKPSTSCSTSPTRACGWRTATSPSTTRAA